MNRFSLSGLWPHHATEMFLSLIIKEFYRQKNLYFVYSSFTPDVTNQMQHVNPNTIKMNQDTILTFKQLTIK